MFWCEASVDRTLQYQATVRALAVASVMLATVVPPSLADQRPAIGGDVSAKTLTAKDVERYLEPYVEGIRKCYLSAGRPPSTRLMRLELIIHRDGSIFRLRVITPQLSRPAARKIETCVRTASKEWRFPARSGFTHVTIPFFFHRANPRGAGPYESCWSPRGCPTREPKESRP